MVGGLAGDAGGGHRGVVTMLLNRYRKDCRDNELALEAALRRGNKETVDLLCARRRCPPIRDETAQIIPQAR